MKFTMIAIKLSIKILFLSCIKLATLITCSLSKWKDCWLYSSNDG